MIKTPQVALIALLFASSCSKNDNATRLSDPEGDPSVLDGPSDEVTNSDVSTESPTTTATSTGSSTESATDQPGVFSLADLGMVPSRNVTVTWTASIGAQDMNVSLGTGVGCELPTHEDLVPATDGKVTFTGVANGTYQVCAKATNGAGETKATEKTLTVGPVVVGQASFVFDVNGTITPSATQMVSPASSILVGGKLIVADEGNSRVLIWNQLPNGNGKAADVVLGQADFTSFDDNRGSTTPTAATMNYPGAVVSDGTRLFVADGGNHRILIWNTMPTANGQPADLVLGQVDMVSNVNPVTYSATSLNYPYAMAISGTKLLVSDYHGHRILIWNTIPTATNQAANVIIGQADMTGSTATLTATGLHQPGTMAIDGAGGLWIADSGNARILKFNAIPTSDGSAANLVVGQADFVTKVAGPTQSLMSGPWGLEIVGTKLLVADYEDSRILIWDALPTTDGKSADHVDAQPDYVTQSVVSPPTTDSLNNPYDVHVTDGTLVISDYRNARTILRPYP